MNAEFMTKEDIITYERASWISRLQSLSLNVILCFYKFNEVIRWHVKLFLKSVFVLWIKCDYHTWRWNMDLMTFCIPLVCAALTEHYCSTVSGFQKIMSQIQSNIQNNISYLTRYHWPKPMATIINDFDVQVWSVHWIYHKWLQLFLVHWYFVSIDLCSVFWYRRLVQTNGVNPHKPTNFAHCFLIGANGVRLCVFDYFEISPIVITTLACDVSIFAF